MPDLDQKIRMKKLNAEKENLKFELTKQDITQLLEETNISVSDWSLHGYHLARFGDSGDYILGNCRFITALENFQEKKVSNAMLKACAQNLRDFNAGLTEDQIERRKDKLAEMARERGKKYGSKFGKTFGGSNRTPESELKQTFDRVSHIDFDTHGSLKIAGDILHCSHTQIRRLIKKWKNLGFQVKCTKQRKSPSK